MSAGASSWAGMQKPNSGAGFHGLAALLNRVNSCASNVTVVNMDNGFDAGYVASLINRLRGEELQS